MIGAVLGVLTGGRITRLELYALGAVVVLAAAWLWLRGHDAKVLAEQAARRQAAVAAQQVADARAATAAEAAVSAEAIKRADVLARARMEIAHAPPPAPSCAAPAAVVRALGALRAGP